MSGNSAVAMDSLKSGQQLITFESSESSAITHDSVVILPSESAHATGSSHVKMKTIVDYAWEHKYYDGHIAACRGEYLAYAIKGKSGGVVRVVSRGTDDRALIKGMSGAVKDLAFAHTSNETLLAVVDEMGNLFVFTVDEDLNKKLVVAPYLGLRREHEASSSPATACRRVVWCPYIPDEECDEQESEETAKLLLLSHGNKADLLNVAILAEEHGPGPHLVDDLTEGFMEILDHGRTVTDAAFSPDGTALATASVDGFVKFYQIYMQDKNSPRMLHEWQPHDGQPLSSLFFLDNHRDQDPNEPFWKYAVTGACHNTELKVWTCESWNCLQTVRLQPSPAGDLPTAASPACLQAALDSSAQYLLLSDIHRRMLYVLSLSTPESAVKYFTSVHEFRLMTPGLSLAIVDARRRPIKPFENVDQLDPGGCGDAVGVLGSGADEADDDALPEGVVIRCYMVQPRSLQECVIVYQSSAGGRHSAAGAGLLPDAISSQNGESLECLTDHLSDVTLNTTVASAGDSVTGAAASAAATPTEQNLASPFAEQPPPSPPPPPPSQQQQQQQKQEHQEQQEEEQQQQEQHQQQPISLMTPEEFTSPSRAPDMVTPPTPVGLGVPLPDVKRQVVRAVDLMEPLPDAKRADASPLMPAAYKAGSSGRQSSSPQQERKPEAKKEAANSCGSSPSIEVQEILNKSAEAAQEAKVTPLKSMFPSPPPPPDPPVKAPGKGAAPPPPPPPPPPPSAPAPAPSLSSPARSSGGGGQNGWPSVPALQTPTAPAPPTAATAASVAASGTVAGAGPLAAGGVSPPVIPGRSSAPLGGGDEKADSSQGVVLGAIASVLTTVRDLNAEVKQLRAQLQLLQHRQQTPPAAASPDVSRLLDTALTAHQRHIEELLLSRDREERQRLERQLNALSNSLSSTIKQKVDSAVRQEFKDHVLPLVTSRLKPLEGQIRHEMSARIGDVEAAVKDSISKTVSVKAVSEAVAHSLTQSLQQAMVARYREVFSSTALPAFERSTRELLHQINGTFSAGTKEYLQQMEQQVERLRRQREPPLQHLQSAVEAVRLSVDHMGSTVKEDRQRQEKHRQDEAAFLAQVRDEIRRSVTACLEEQSARGVSAAVPAGAAVPAAQPLRQQITQMMSFKQYNAAFQLALSASDLELVVLACELVEPQQLFAESPPCPLAQPVLLALVQQLSADLSKKTDLKCRYLEEAVMQIEANHPTTKEHLRPILARLQTQLQAFIGKADSQQAPLVRSMRMLLMAVRSLAA